ncbi:hypothetical protein UUC_18162, partial [Rhodanobacter denitrificans]
GSIFALLNLAYQSAVHMCRVFKFDDIYFFGERFFLPSLRILNLNRSIHTYDWNFFLSEFYKVCHISESYFDIAIEHVHCVNKEFFLELAF